MSGRMERIDKFLLTIYLLDWPVILSLVSNNHLALLLTKTDPQMPLILWFLTL